MPLVALVLMTAVWGVTFVQVKDALELYPLFAFLAVRFALAAGVLAVPAASRLRAVGRRGAAAAGVLGGLLAGGYALQTAGLERTTVSSTGFVTGTCVVLTPVLALVILRTRVPAGAWLGVALSAAGLVMLSGVGAGSAAGDLLVLGGAAAYALQIVLLERFAPRYDPLAFTFLEMVAAFGVFAAIALAVGEVEAPSGLTVWGAIVVTGLFASALGFLVQTWAQRRTTATQTALAFAMEPVFTGIFGYALAGDRLGYVGWGGCAAILAGIVVAEPAAADVLIRRLRREPRAA